MTTLWRQKPIRELLSNVAKITIDADAYKQEILSLHNKRKVRFLNKRTNVNLLREAALVESAYRSRVVAILVELKQVLSIIEPMRDLVILRCVNTYQDLIPVPTKGEKRDYMFYGIESRIPLFQKLRDTIETAEYIIEDIDKSAWTLKLVTQTFDLSTRPEYH